MGEASIVASDKYPEQEKILPTFTVRHHTRPVVRVGLVLGLASAGILVVWALISSNLFLIIYHLSPQEIEGVVNILNLMAFIGVSLGLAGNITVSTTLPRRTAAWVSLALVGGFIFYVTSFFISEYNWQTMNLAWFVAGGIVAAFPQACVSIVLRRKGWLPKAMTLISCAFGAYSVLQNCVTYFRLFAPTLDLDPAALWLISGVGIVLRYVFYFLWCGVWVDLNVRPARYLVKQIPHSRTMRGWRRISLKRKHLVIIIAGGCAGGIVIASLALSGVFAEPMTQEHWGEFSSQGYTYANDFCGNGSAFYTTGSSPEGSLLIKWDASGNVVWNRTWVNAEAYKGGKRVWANESCAVTLSLYHYNPSIMNTGEYLIIWSPNGSVIQNWSIYDKSATEASAVIGNGSYIYTTGHAIGGDFAIVKWDAAGNIVWKKIPSRIGASAEIGTDMVIVDGYIYVLGYSEGPEGAMLLKYAENGTLVWRDNYPLGGEDVTPNHLWCSGEYFYASGDNIMYGSADSCLMKWTRDGELVWTKVDEDFNRWYNAFGCWGVETGFFTCEVPPPSILPPRIVKWSPDGTRQWRHDLPDMEIAGAWVDNSTFVFCGTYEGHSKMFFAKYSYNENFTFIYFNHSPNWRDIINYVELFIIVGLAGLVLVAVLVHDRLKSPTERVIQGRKSDLGFGVSGTAGGLSVILGYCLPYIYPALFTPVNYVIGTSLQGIILAGGFLIVIGTGVAMRNLDLGHSLIFWGSLVSGINILACWGASLIAKSPPDPNKPVPPDQETLKQQEDAKRPLGATQGSAFAQWHDLAVSYETDAKLGEALYCWDQAALLGDPSGKLRGIQLRAKHIKVTRPVDLPAGNSQNQGNAPITPEKAHAPTGTPAPPGRSCPACHAPVPTNGTICESCGKKLDDFDFT